MADALNSGVYALGNTGSGSNPRFADLPAENPKRDQLDAFVNIWDKELAAMGMAPFVKGIDPPLFLEMENIKLNDYPALTVGEGISAFHVEGRRVKRMEIERTNNMNDARKSAIRLERGSLLAQYLITHLRPHAGLRLKELQRKHLISGTVYSDDAVYDGFAMYNEIRALRNKKLSKVSRDEVKALQKKLDSNPLKDGHSVDAFNTRIEIFTRDINPYLDAPLTGEALGEWIVEQMSSGLTDAGLSLMRDLHRSSKLDDQQEVITECQTIVDAHASITKTKPLPIAAAIDGGLSNTKLTKLLRSDDVSALAAVLGSSANITVEQRSKVAARMLALANRQPGGGTARRTGQMPDGNQCESGTCRFKHRGPCYRDPRVLVAPQAVFDKPEQLARIEGDRKLNADKMKMV